MKKILIVHPVLAGLVLSLIFCQVFGCTKRAVGPASSIALRRQQQERHSGTEKPPFSQEELNIIVNLDMLLKQWEMGFTSGLDEEQIKTAHQIRNIAIDNMSLLKRAMQTNDVEIKMVTTLSLGFSGKKEAVGMLVAALHDKNVPIKTNAAFSLGILGEKEVPTDSLVKLLEDEEPSVRNSAAFALSRILTRGKDAGGVLDVLHRATNDSVPEIRREVVRALTSVASQDSIPYLVKSLKDSDEYVRINSAIALGVINDKSAIEPLIQALQDSDSRVRESAIDSLKKIIGVEDINDAKGWQEWWSKNKK
ncbi:MAG: HEAT repeat domain-containing protein [Planctomycetota bacterium]|nr:HEAT repeat domain-containing protein [Planctomycetota bacterium]MDI6787964.1 HEAT repeat domain-containing protein [Planctomycetota bacterium]